MSRFSFITDEAIPLEIKNTERLAAFFGLCSEARMSAGEIKQLADLIYAQYSRK